MEYIIIQSYFCICCQNGIHHPTVLRVHMCCVIGFLSFIFCVVFSSPELKFQVTFSDGLMSVFHPSICMSLCPSVCLQTFHIFIFSNAFGPISTKLGTKCSWIKGIQVCSKEGPHSFSRGDNNR